MQSSGNIWLMFTKRQISVAAASMTFWGISHFTSSPKGRTVHENSWTQAGCRLGSAAESFLWVITEQNHNSSSDSKGLSAFLTARLFLTLPPWLTLNQYRMYFCSTALCYTLLDAEDTDMEDLLYYHELHWSIIFIHICHNSICKGNLLP